MHEKPIVYDIGDWCWTFVGDWLSF